MSDNTILFRGINVDKEHISLLKECLINKTATNEKAYFSTSTDLKIAKKYAKGKKDIELIYVIKAKAGTHAVGIEEISMNKKEREVLLRTPTIMPLTIEEINENYGDILPPLKN